MPLQVDDAKPDYSVIEFCTICKKCADSCPSRAISFNDREIINGVNRWQINQEACFTLWCNLGTDCGRCVSVCPYSHENNALHNLVRTGIKNNKVFRHLALRMDDVFYGRKPKSKEIPKALKI
jgi:ferredoxin